jgi:hypothetical protein
MGLGGTGRVRTAEKTTDGPFLGFRPDYKLSCGYLAKSTCVGREVIASAPSRRGTEINPLAISTQLSNARPGTRSSGRERTRAERLL